MVEPLPVFWDWTVVDTVPDHCVSQAFQIVPTLFSFAANTASKFPSTLIIKSGAVSVSNHSSPLGVNTILPTQFAV